VLISLNEVTRRALEEKMARGYEYQSDFARKYVAEGRREGAAQAKAHDVITVIEARGLPVAEDIRARILKSSDLAELDRWLRRAVSLRSASELFDG
jgi:hypothetical protein